MATTNRRHARQGHPGRVGSGIGVDSTGGPVFDPTKNVLDLVDASVTRIDDMMELRARVANEQFRRMEEMLGAQKQVDVLRAEHNREIRHMESDRVDKIRSVDVANAAATAAQLLSAVTTLATTAQATAETLRNQVAATAAAVASQTERVVNPIIERLALLEKSSNFGQGRAMVADPAMAELAAEMRKIASSADRRTGKGEGVNAAWLILLGAVSLIATLIAIGSFVFADVKAPVAAVAPQVIYVPAPAAGNSAPLPAAPR